MDKYTQLYINGSSLSCGGALGYQSAAWRYYTTELDIENWATQKELSYGNILGSMMNLEVINEAKEGGGLDRLIRKTYDFISTKTLEELSKILFIFDIPLQPARFEVYSRKHSDYFAVSISYKGGSDVNQYDEIEISRDWHDSWFSKVSFSRDFSSLHSTITFEELKENDELLNKIVDFYIDYDVETKRLLRQLTMFYSFLDKLKISYIRDPNETIFASSINFGDRNNTAELIKKLKLFDSTNENVINLPTIWNLAEKKKWRILDETPVYDAHLGYFGNKKYAEYLYEKLK